MTLNAQPAGLVALFVDYDNVYLSLKRRNEEAALRFAKNVTFWLKQIETGSLVHDRGGIDVGPRRLSLLRCYGNPVVDPRHNGGNDEGAFVNVRNNFMRAGFEIIDCPPLTSRLKNSSDIRIALEIQDLMQHPVPIEEFIILSSDSDFTPVLHRLRAHGRRTTIFTTRNTATPYTAVSDGEIHEEALIDFLLKQAPHADNVATMPFLDPEKTDGHDGIHNTAAAYGMTGNDTVDAIVAVLLGEVNKADSPPLLSFLADRAQRTLGADATSGSNWGGYNSFRNLLENALPIQFQLSQEQPYRLVDTQRFGQVAKPTSVDHLPRDMPQFMRKESLSISEPMATGQMNREPQLQTLSPIRGAKAAPVRRAPVLNPNGSMNQGAVLQQTQASDIHRIISQIHEKTQLPALAPTEYRKLFHLMAEEIEQFHYRGKTTATRVLAGANNISIDVDLYDVKFILDLISKSNPRFLGPISGSEFGGRFFREIMMKARAAGLSLDPKQTTILRSWFVDEDAGQVPFDLSNQSARQDDPLQGSQALGEERRDRSLPQQATNIYLERMQRRTAPLSERRKTNDTKKTKQMFGNQFMPEQATRPQDIILPEEEPSIGGRLSQLKKVIGRSS